MAVLFSPWGNQQFIDANGNPLVGGKIQTFTAGSSTPLATYTDASGGVPQSNPIILNSRGAPTLGEIWLTSGALYKFQLFDSANNLIDTVDNISGVSGVTTTNDEWVDSGVTPVYVSSSSYTVLGDQTTQLHQGRRQKFQTTAGIVYGTILTSVFTTLTTVTMQMDGSQILDSGLSSVQNSILRNNVWSLPIRMGTTSGTDTYTANVGTLRYVIGNEYEINFSNQNTTTSATIALDGLAQQNITLQNGYSLYPGALKGQHTLRWNGSAFTVLNPNQMTFPFRRQTVIYGPVDTNGLSAFGGSTGSGTVTISGTLVATAANSNLDRIGTITNASWTGLAAIGTGTGYLNLTVNADGTCTTVLRTLQSIYRNGGTDVITNGQFVFNTQEMVGKVGNGTIASQSYEVIVGEVGVTAGVVTSISWYQLRNHYYARDTGVPSTSRITKNHLIGMTPRPTGVAITLECQSSDAGYSALDQVPVVQFTSSGQGLAIAHSCDSKQVGIISNTASLFVANKGTGSSTAYVAANWDLLFDIDRGWA